MNFNEIGEPVFDKLEIANMVWKLEKGIERSEQEFTDILDHLGYVECDSDNAKNFIERLDTLSDLISSNREEIGKWLAK